MTVSDNIDCLLCKIDVLNMFVIWKFHRVFLSIYCILINSIREISRSFSKS